MTADILEGAADLLMRDGWLRHEAGPSDPRVHAPRCVAGAIDAAAQAIAATLVGVCVGDARVGALGALRCTVGDAPGLWNDQTCPDVTTAIDTLRRAAKSLR